LLLSSRFVYIHEPKTGGTSVNYALGRLHDGLTDVRGSRLRDPGLGWGLPDVAFQPERVRAVFAERGHAPRKYGRMHTWHDHGTCAEIPLGFRSRTILATVRNPLETYVSLYLFEWWKRPEYHARYERSIPDFSRRFPSFPDLSFDEYMELLHAECVLPADRRLDDDGALGFLTERFVRYYFRVGRRARNLERTLRSLHAATIESGDFGGEMFPVRFIHTSQLNDKLRAFLLEVGYEAEDLEFLRTLAHVRPIGGKRLGFSDRAASAEWPRYYTPERAAATRRRDRLIFSLFPELSEEAAAA
jgi:hypothetical protein